MKVRTTICVEKDTLQELKHCCVDFDISVSKFIENAIKKELGIKNGK